MNRRQSGDELPKKNNNNFSLASSLPPAQLHSRTHTRRDDASSGLDGGAFLGSAGRSTPTREWQRRKDGVV